MESASVFSVERQLFTIESLSDDILCNIVRILGWMETLEGKKLTGSALAQVSRRMRRIVMKTNYSQVLVDTCFGNPGLDIWANRKKLLPQLNQQLALSAEVCQNVELYSDYPSDPRMHLPILAALDRAMTQKGLPLTEIRLLDMQFGCENSKALFQNVLNNAQETLASIIVDADEFKFWALAACNFPQLKHLGVYFLNEASFDAFECMIVALLGTSKKRTWDHMSGIGGVDGKKKLNSLELGCIEMTNAQLENRLRPLGSSLANVSYLKLFSRGSRKVGTPADDVARVVSVFPNLTALKLSNYYVTGDVLLHIRNNYSRTIDVDLDFGGSEGGTHVEEQPDRIPERWLNQVVYRMGSNLVHLDAGSFEFPTSQLSLLGKLCTRLKTAVLRLDMKGLSFLPRFCRARRDTLVELTLYRGSALPDASPKAKDVIGKHISKAVKETGLLECLQISGLSLKLHQVMQILFHVGRKLRVFTADFLEFPCYALVRLLVAASENCPNLESSNILSPVRIKCEDLAPDEKAILLKEMVNFLITCKGFKNANLEEWGSLFGSFPPDRA